MKNAIWTDTFGFGIGEVGFLVERHHLTNGGEPTFALQERPACKNLSGAPTYEGWCGTTNDNYLCAHGLARVLRIAKNERVLVERLTDDTEISAQLEELGYPDLR